MYYRLWRFEQEGNVRAALVTRIYEDVCRSYCRILYVMLQEVCIYLAISMLICCFD